MPARLSMQELLDVRRHLSDPTKQFWPRTIVEGLLGEIDRLTALIGSEAINHARERYDYARLNGGVPIDLNKPQLDRDGLRWCCVGFFRLRGETEEQPMMSRMVDGAPDDYTLRTLIEKRGPLRPLQEHSTTLPSEDFDALEDAPENGNERTRSAVRRLHAVREAPQ